MSLTTCTSQVITCFVTFKVAEGLTHPNNSCLRAIRVLLNRFLPLIYIISNRNNCRGILLTIISTSYFRLNRFSICWKAPGFSSSNTTTSPSRITLLAVIPFRIIPTISGNESVTSSMRREKILILSPFLWICTLAPSNFHSTATEPISLITGSIPWDILASICFMGRPSVISILFSPSIPFNMVSLATIPISFVSI